MLSLLPRMDKEQIIKGSLSTIILQLIQNNGRMYGYEITKAVKEGSKGKTKLTEAALYPSLRKLVDAGLLETESEIVSGRERKYYRLTQEGHKASSDYLETIKESITALQNLLKYRLGHG